jgi:hypothetical protein
LLLSYVVAIDIVDTAIADGYASATCVPGAIKLACNILLLLRLMLILPQLLVLLLLVLLFIFLSMRMKVTILFQLLCLCSFYYINI